MNPYLIFIIGFFGGAFFGMVIMAVLAMAKDNYENRQTS